MWDLGAFVYTLLVIITSIKILFEIKEITKLFLLLWIAGPILWFLTMLIISFQEKALLESPDLFQVIFRMPSTAVFTIFK